MDRTALAKRLEGLSKVFASGTPYHRDLKAMSEVLAKVEDEKFKAILSADFTPDQEDKEAAGWGEPSVGLGVGGMPGARERTPMTERYQGGGKGSPANLEALVRAVEQMAGGDPAKLQKVKRIENELRSIMQPVQAPSFAGKPAIPPQEETAMSAEASVNTGMFWNKEASEAVLNNLLRDVVGMDKAICCDTKRHLDKDQIPDGTHNGEKAPTLKPEQTPDQKDVLKSDIYEKSKKTPLKKEAAEDKEEENKEDKDATACDKEEDKKEDKAATSCDKEEDKKEDKSASLDDIEKARKEKEQKETKEKVKKLEEDKKKEEKKPAEEDKSANVVEGIELGSPMDEVTLDAAEQEKLSQLFA